MYELFIVISEMKVATDAAFWRKGKIKEFLLIPIYPAMLSDACIGQTMIPVRKSATAKPIKARFPRLPQEILKQEKCQKLFVPHGSVENL